MSEHPSEHPSASASRSTPQDAATPAVPTDPGPSAEPSPSAAPGPSPEPPRVTYLPAPTGPNWGLVVVGLVFVAIAVGVVANQVSGFQLSQLSETGPSILVVVGLGCALVGLVGIVARRRRS